MNDVDYLKSRGWYTDPNDRNIWRDSMAPDPWNVPGLSLGEALTVQRERDGVRMDESVAP